MVRAEAPAMWLRKWRRDMPEGVANMNGLPRKGWFWPGVSCELVLQDELVAFEHGPKHVLQSAGSVALAGHHELVRNVDFVLRRLASEGRLEQVLNLLGGLSVANRDRVQEAAL